MAGAQRRPTLLARTHWTPSVQLLLVALFQLGLSVAQTTLSISGVLVVLNEPRLGSQLTGGLSYAVRLPRYDDTGEFVLYSLRFAPGVARPGTDFKTGDPLQLQVDLERSGPLLEALLPGGTAPWLSGSAGGGPPGVLYVSAWSYAPYAVAKNWPEGSNPAYYNGWSGLSLRAVVWVVTEVCGAPVQGGASAEDVSELLFGPAPGAGLPPAANASGGGGGAASRPPAPPPPTTLSRFWDECSYGAVRMKRSDSLVLELKLPCGGRLANGAAWDLTGGAAAAAGEEEAGAGGSGGSVCGGNELWGMMEYAVNYTRQELQLDTAPYLRRVLLLPPGAAFRGGSGSGSGSSGPLCPNWQWAQRGTFGCDGARGCDVWVKADRSQVLEAAVTQLGASMALRPATAPREAGAAGAAATTGASASASDSAAAAAAWPPTDPSCPMGAAHAGFRCFNAPNAYKLGFASPVKHLKAENTFLASDMPVSLPAAATAAPNMLLIEPNWVRFSPFGAAAPSAAAAATAPAAPLLFAQYRLAVGGDAGLAAPLRRGRLLLHSLNASLLAAAGGPERPTPATRLLATLAPGESYRYEPAKLVVRFRSLDPPPPGDPGGVTGGAAQLGVCRYLAASEAEAEDGCFNGLDDDCDGLPDELDPDCAAALLEL